MIIGSRPVLKTGGRETGLWVRVPLSPQIHFNMEKITIKELKELIYSVPIPTHWRHGQFVFNRVEALFGRVAREVQFVDHIDCFYDDTKIDRFLDAVLIRLNK